MSVFINMDFFQDIVCINLDISKDRKEHAEFYFKKHNIPARFFTAAKHTKGGVYGCFDSHIQILKEAYDKNLDNIWVFEDDFLPTEAFTQENMNDALHFMKTNPNWDIFYFGYSFIKDNIYGITTIFNGKYITDNILQFNPMFTQSLCYNKKAIKKILDNYNDYIGIIHYDHYLANFLNLENYCIIPMMFDQNLYFQFNIEAKDIVEYLFRKCYPFFAFIKLNYRVSLAKFIYNKYEYSFKLIFFIILLYTFL